MAFPLLPALLASILAGGVVLTQLGKPFRVEQGKKYRIVARVMPAVPENIAKSILPMTQLLAGFGVKGIQTTALYTEMTVEGLSPVTREIQREPFVIPMGVATYSLTIVSVQEIP